MVAVPCEAVGSAEATTWRIGRDGAQRRVTARSHLSRHAAIDQQILDVWALVLDCAYRHIQQTCCQSLEKDKTSWDTPASAAANHPSIITGFA